MSINGQASTVFANTISGLDSLNVSNITVNGVDLTATYVPYQNANSDVNLGIRNLTATTITATTSMITPTPSLGDSSTLVSTTAFVKNQGYIGTAGLANYALLSGAIFTGNVGGLTATLSDNDTKFSTTAFVKGQNYITSSALTPYALITSLSNYALLSGSTFTGAVNGLTATLSDNDTKFSTTAFVKGQNYITSSALAPYALITSLSNYALLSGSTFTGNVFGLTATLSDNDTKFSTTAFVKGQNYITSSALTPYALIASPTFTGTPSAPTPVTSDNTTTIATTAYVKSNLASYALIASPTFTGTPSAPTPATSDNTTKIATTAYVKSNLSSVNAITINTTSFNNVQDLYFVGQSTGGVSGASNTTIYAQGALLLEAGTGIIKAQNLALSQGLTCDTLSIIGLTTAGAGTSFLVADATGNVYKTSTGGLATITPQTTNINYYLIGTSITSGALSVASVDNGNRFYFNPNSGILFVPSITTTGTSSIAGYLTTASASSTYLTIANASSTYLTIANASSTYLTIANASTTYLPLLGGTLYSPFGTNLKLTNDSLGFIKFLRFSIVATPDFGFLGTLDGDSLIRASNHCYYGVGASMTHKFYVNSTKRLEINSTNTVINGGLQVTLEASGILEVVGTAGLNMTINRSGTSFANYGTGTYYKLNNKIYGAILMGIESSNYGYFCLDPLNNNVLPGTSGLYTQALMWGDWTNGVQVNSTFTAPNFIASSTIFSTMTNTLRLNGGSTGSKFGQIHMNNGSYNLIMRQDTYDFYFLIGSNPDGAWNSLRPFYITLASGRLVSENGQDFTGGTTISTSCLLSSGVPLKLATGNGDTGIAMELASGTTPIMNLQSNFRGTTNTAHLGACFRIDTRNSPLYQWFYRPAGSGTENLIMNLNSSGDLGCTTLTLSNTAQQTYAPRQVLIGSNGTVSQWGQLMSYSFACGGGGFGWGGNCWMNTIGGQTNAGASVLTTGFMVKSTSGSRISFSGTWSAYLGVALMGMNVYFYNATNLQYYFGGTFYQYQNISGNHACGGAHGFVEGIPAGNYLLFIQASTAISTDTNDYCSFSIIIHP